MTVLSTTTEASAKEDASEDSDDGNIGVDIGKGDNDGHEGTSPTEEVEVV